MAKRRDRDDDYDDDFDDRDDDRPRRPRSQAGSSGGKTAVIIIAIIAAVVLIIFFACAGVVYMVFTGAKNAVEDARVNMVARAKEMEKQHKIEDTQRAATDKDESKRAAESFLKVIQEKRAGEAYLMFNSNMKRKFPDQKAFTAYVSKHPALSSPQVLVDANPLRPSSRMEYTFTAMDGDQFALFTIVVVREGVTWKVEQFSTDQDRP